MTLDKPSRLLFFTALAVILFMTLTPKPPQLVLDQYPFGDKVEHFSAFAGLALFARIGFRRAPGWLILERLSFLGALIEVFQATQLSQRDCDWKDWVADTLGAAVMLLAVSRFGLLERLARRRAI